MGAAKAAMRCAASRGLGEALDTVNRVLPSVKEPAMYATLAAIRFGAADPGVEYDAEYTLAGHLPILHYRAAAGTIEPLTLQQFPLGFFDDSRYETRRVGCAPGDVFALFSDGIVDARLRPPDRTQRDNNPSFVWGEVRNAAGASKTARLRTANGYSLTVASSLGILSTLLAQPRMSGFATPCELVGADFVSTLPGSSPIRIDS